MELREYQERIIQQAKQVIDAYRLVYLALDTRLGKTFISLFLADNYGIDVLFITRKKVIKSIEKDYKESGLNLNLKIISMDSLHLLSMMEIMMTEVIIIDEAHNFAMYPKPSLRANNLRKITKGKICILLSATPCPESWSQIFHQLWGCNFSAPFISDYKNFYAWAKQYVDIKKKYIGTGIQVNDYSQAHIDEIKSKISPYFITMTQAEAGFNHTEFDEDIRLLEMPEGLAEIYHQIRKEKYANITIINDNHDVIADTSAMVMSKMHQLCGGTIIDESEEGLLLSYYKVQELHKILTEYKKVAVFYKFKAEPVLIERYLNNYVHIPVTYDWQEFNAMDRGIFLSQFLSGREGINLATANALVFYNIDHAYLSYYQTKNRIQEIDREVRPKLILLFTKDGLEPKIFKAVCKKKNYTTRMFERAYLKSMDES